MTIRAI
ncbi:hypothetical protein ECEC1864_2414, partial [Escherichia coli EC1864]